MPNSSGSYTGLLTPYGSVCLTAAPALDGFGDSTLKSTVFPVGGAYDSVAGGGGTS
jgi:hypothetical protein